MNALRAPSWPAAALLFAAGCAAPPWLMGRPLDGTPSIPPAALNETVGQRQAAAATARTFGLLSRELPALVDLEALERLDSGERVRLVQLLALRALDFEAMGRAIPRSDDLEHLARLSPAQGEAMRAVRAVALRDAGDAWLAIGDDRRALDAYRKADGLGAPALSFRVLAATGGVPSPRTLLRDLRETIAALPLRALRPYAELYLRKQGDDRATLERLLAAARQFSDTILMQRLREALAKIDDTAGTPAPPPAPTAAPPAPPPGVDLERWVSSGPTLSRRLLPLLASTPALLAPGDQSRDWALALQGEDPTSPAVQEITAVIDGLARRFGGVERKLGDLVYYSPDRYDGFLRAAAVWERVARPREACVLRVRAARWRDDPEDTLWRDIIACTRADPGAGDWRAIRRYVLDRAPADRRDALAAALDAASDAGDAPIARPAPAPPQ
ncbi:MAG TPA: hypothetical protein VMU50_17675 [Polyangia bacterium]|nr:hypothetical protein [Polyangia bacterium]